MFDIAFSELMVIGVVALIVIGPERLPKTARTLGLLYGRLRRYVTDVKADISREMDLEELRRLRGEVHSAAKEFETSMTSTASAIESNVRTVESELNNAAALAQAPAGTASSTMPLASNPVADASSGTDAASRSDQSSPPFSSADTDTTSTPASVPARQATLPGLERP